MLTYDAEKEFEMESNHSTSAAEETQPQPQNDVTKFTLEEIKESALKQPDIKEATNEDDSIPHESSMPYESSELWVKEEHFENEGSLLQYQFDSIYSKIGAMRLETEKCEREDTIIVPQTFDYRQTQFMQ